MLSSIPQTPHSQPQNSSEMNTAAEFMFAIRPVIQVVTNVPTSGGDRERRAGRPATPSESESNCMNAAMPVAAAVTPGPR